VAGMTEIKKSQILNPTHVVLRQVNKLKKGDLVVLPNGFRAILKEDVEEVRPGWYKYETEHNGTFVTYATRMVPVEVPNET